MSKLISLILEEIFPGLHADRSNSVISKLYYARQKFQIDISDIQPGTEKEYIEQVEADLKEQHDRKKIIEDKAKSLLLTITASITVITFSLSYLHSLIINFYQAIAVIILFISILYFVIGAIRALQTLNIRQFNVVQAEVQIINGDSFKLSAKKPDSDFLKDLIKRKQLNDLINTQLSNYAYASFNLIRNGIILFVVFFIATICINYFSNKNKTKNIYEVNKEIQMKINDSINVKIPYTFELKYDIQNLKINKKESN